jgi:hypothetical protein
MDTNGDNEVLLLLNLLWRRHRAIRIPSRRALPHRCSSVTSQHTELGSAMYHRPRESLVAPELRTTPTPAFAFPLLGGAS